jgi:outer membrane receptor protein involved in Fe transport
MQRSLRRLAILAVTAFAGILGTSGRVSAQVTTSSMRGSVVDDKAAPIEGVRVEAVHTPSGTRYASLTRADGRFAIPGMRVGGPYEVIVTRIGYQRQSRTDVFTSLGTATDLAFTLSAVATQVAAVTVTGEAGIISASRTGAATAVAREQIEQLPTISRRIGDFVRLTPQASGSSFAGVDNRLNNITVDGSYFNNSFGLGGQPGDRTGVAPISIDAIEAVQVNIAPFDVRQSNFTGAAVNTVTKSGTNDLKGSLYYLTRNQDFAGKNAGAATLVPGKLDFSNIGATIGGPLIKDKLFFFGSFENDGITEPGINFRANTGGEPATGNVTRVLASDLDQLSSFLRTNFGYETGPYQGYDHETPSRRFLGKLDYNLNDNNKFSLRYSHLDSETDVLVSTSSSLGFGGRRGSVNALSFQNGNYSILENIRSTVAEWNSTFKGNMSNQLIVGYNSSDESRGSRGTVFPLVDILKDGASYTSFGFEPFTPNNELRYNSFQLQNNFTIYGEKHELTFGASLERYKSENVFFPGSQSAYIYNSLEDFYADANGFLANPNRTTSPVNLRRFQVRYSNIPGQTKPVQPLEVTYSGLYAQDEWRASDNLRLSLGLRVEVPVFGETGFQNTAADALTFRDPSGANKQFETAKLPNANLLWSPRLGMNWDVNGDATTQIRGGTGIFTGRPAYVWISNQIGNTGVLTGFSQLDNTTARPFNPNPDTYKPDPSTITGAPAANYELALTEPDFRFPQVWRTNIAVDRKLPWGLVGTAEFLYGREINGISYYNANLGTAQSAFTGPDTRPRWTGTNRIHSNVSSAVVLANQADGSSYNISGSLERAFRGGLFVKTAYNYGMSRNTVDAGSIAFGSWNNNQHSGNPNAQETGVSANAAGHRFFVAATYKKDWFSFGGTGFSLFYEARNAGNASYVYSGDLNGDGGTANDLLYIPRNTSEMNFQAFTSSGKTFTVEEQTAAWEAFIQQDKYLSANRGSYAERGAVFLPIFHRADVSITQDIFRNVAGRRNTIQLRLDVLNAGNLINKNWGQSYTFTSTSPLVAAGASADGRARHRMRNFGQELISESFQRTASPFDVWRMQLGLRYIFN